MFDSVFENMRNLIRKILLQETRFQKYQDCYVSDIMRMEIIDDFIKDVNQNPKHNIEKPNYKMLLDDWDGYSDQIYIQNDLVNGKIIFYEGWVDSCWEAAYLKKEYEGLGKEEIINKIIKERFPKIAEANQISLISLSKKMFEGTKPMEGAELKALYKAMKKQRNSNIESLL